MHRVGRFFMCSATIFPNIPAALAEQPDERALHDLLAVVAAFHGIARCSMSAVHPAQGGLIYRGSEHRGRVE